MAVSVIGTSAVSVMGPMGSMAVPVMGLVVSTAVSTLVAMEVSVSTGLSKRVSALRLPDLPHPSPWPWLMPAIPLGNKHRQPRPTHASQEPTGFGGAGSRASLMLCCGCLRMYRSIVCTAAWDSIVCTADRCGIAGTGNSQ